MTIEMDDDLKNIFVRSTLLKIIFRVKNEY